MRAPLVLLLSALLVLVVASTVLATAIPDAETQAEEATLSIAAHLQTYGWMDGEVDGTAGLPGENKRVEALTIELADVEGGVEYAVYVEGMGWLDGADGSEAGTTGQSTPIRALKVALTGEAAQTYDVWYRVWVDGYGWTGWARNGAACGTSTSGAMVEAVQVVLAAKGSAAPGDVTPAYITSSFTADDEATATAALDEEEPGEAEDAEETEDAGSAESSSESTSAQAATSTDGTQDDSDDAAEDSASSGGSASSSDDSAGSTTDADGSSDDAADSEEDDSSSSDESPYAWVGELDVAQSVSQLIIVSVGSGSSATLSMYTKSSGEWTLVISTSASIGYNGIGKTAEGDGKTPTGVYSFTRAFGNNSNPGTSLSYLQVDDTYYWVDDSDSAYYNQLVSTNDVTVDWSSAEHIASYPTAYAYCLALSYNSSCTPGKGSAIFLHCSTGGSTAGCIAISQSAMITVLQNVTSDCAIVIDYSSNIANY